MTTINVVLLLMITITIYISTGIKGSCTVNFISHNDMTSLTSLVGGSGGGAMGAMGKKKKKKQMMPGAGLKKRQKQQSLFTHQKFNCSGKVTEWIFAAEWGGDEMKYPELQIWRPESPGSTVYNKIHSTTVTALSNSINFIYTHILNEPINVVSGDILGVYQPEGRKSKLALYFYETDDLAYQYYYKDKIDQSIDQLDVSNAKDDKTEIPLVTAVIEISQTTSTTTSTPVTTTSSSTSTVTSSSNRVISSTSSTMMSSSRTHTSTSNTLLTANKKSTSSIPSPTSSTVIHVEDSTKIDSQSFNVKVTATTLDQTRPLSSKIDSPFTQSSVNSKSTDNIIIRTTTDNMKTTASEPVQSSNQPSITNNCSIQNMSATNVSNSSCITPRPLTSSDDMSSSTVVIIVLVIVFATIFTFGMMTITICALCLIVYFFKKKRVDVEAEMMSYPAGSRPNRYIQKSVSSPMYESVAVVPIREIVPLGTTSNVDNDQASSLSSVNSNCPSVTIQPDIAVNKPAKKQYYDHLIIEKSGSEVDSKKNGSIVSPYEMPIVPDDAQSAGNIPIGFYDLADEIYVPTENQRLKIADEVKDPDSESLYKSLYKAQHDTIDNKRSKKHPEFFKESQEYWKPSYSKHAIYQQLANKRFREVPRHKIQVIEYLGSGQFATVNKAMWRMAGGDVEVAVKMIKEGAAEDERIKFLQEAAINGQFHHLNVVRLLGVVTVGEPTIIILELLRNGNLKKFLISKRPKKDEIVSSDLPALLLNFSKQISSGMEYLAKKTFVHRDVAARNILVSDQLICKVADFGMSRDLEDNSYYVSQGGLVPIKWTAPEALYYRKYSAASDVWSYGVLLFEIWSLGKKPFSSITNEQYIEDIDEGKRLPPPPGCPKLLYQLMMECWQPEPSDRPSFTEIFQFLKTTSHEAILSLDITDDELIDSPNCDTLGAPLESSHSLFLELQMKYSYDED